MNIFFKQDATPDSLKNTIAYYATQYMVSMAMNMLNNRLNELRQTANPPFTSASAEYGNYFLAKTKEALALDASSKIAVSYTHLASRSTFYFWMNRSATWTMITAASWVNLSLPKQRHKEPE